MEKRINDLRRIKRQKAPEVAETERRIAGYAMKIGMAKSHIKTQDAKVENALDLKRQLMNDRNKEMHAMDEDGFDSLRTS